MKLPLIIKANPIRFASAVGVTIGAVLSLWLNPIVAAVLGAVSALPTTWIVSRQIQNEIRRASDAWRSWQ